jgi:alpha-amylase
MADLNGVMLQGFHWFMKSGSPGFPGSGGRCLWEFLRDEADHYRAIGVDAVWIPPAYKPDAYRSNSVGYDVKDHFDLGEFPLPDNPTGATKYGRKEQLLQAVRALHGDGSRRRIQVYADVVLNHKAGGDEDDYWEAIRVTTSDRTVERWGSGFEEGKIEIRSWTKFEHAERNGTYSRFQWRARHFDSVDTASRIRQRGQEFNDGGKYIYRFLHNEAGFVPADKMLEEWCSLEKGNYDYLTGCDMDYGRYDVREEMKYWGAWLAQELELDGVRLDAVKHISADYVREWLGHVRWNAGRPLFAVAEYISGGTTELHGYLGRVSAHGEHPQPVTLFDFPLRFKLGEAGRLGDRYDLRELECGTLVAEQPALAVTFVENHDYEYGRELNSHVAEWFKPLAYAFILLRQGGYPCLFFPDYYGSEDWFEGSTLWHRGQKPGREYLDLLLKLRKQFALGEERIYAGPSATGWVRMGNVPGATGAMAVVLNTAYDAVQPVRMDTGRANRRFYHLATIRWTEGGFLVVRNRYDRYGDQAEAVWTDASGWGDFPADGGSAAIWIEDGVGLT